MTKDLSITNPIELNPNTDSVESTPTNPIISTDDSTTKTNPVEVASTKKTSTKSNAPKARTKTTKPVSPSFFTQRVKEVRETNRYYFNDTDYIDYNPKFSKSKKDSLIVELINTVDYCNTNNIDYLQTEADMYQYAYYLIIKHFTSLHATLSKWSVENNIAYFKSLYDSGDFELFFDEIFSFEEVQQVMDMLKLTTQTANLYAKDVMLRNKQIDETIQSPILKDKLKNGMIN